jgi:hypothetical protein
MWNSLHRLFEVTLTDGGRASISADNPVMRSSSRRHSVARPSITRTIRGDRTSGGVARMHGNSARKNRSPCRMAMPALQQERADLIDDAGALADQPLAHPVERLQVELLGGLRRNELHRWALHHLGDRLRIAEVVLLGHPLPASLAGAAGARPDHSISRRGGWPRCDGFRSSAAELPPQISLIPIKI